MNRLLRFTLALLAGGIALATHASEAVIIAHPAVPEATLSGEDVTNILLGKKTSWSSGTIKLAVLSEGALHDQVVRTFAQRTADQFDKHWKKLVFSGKGIMPAVFKTEAEVLDYVARTPGALGYVAPSAVNGAVKLIHQP